MISRGTRGWRKQEELLSWELSRGAGSQVGRLSTRESSECGGELGLANPLEATAAAQLRAGAGPESGRGDGEGWTSQGITERETLRMMGVGRGERRRFALGRKGDGWRKRAGCCVGTGI